MQSLSLKEIHDKKNGSETYMKFCLLLGFHFWELPYKQFIKMSAEEVSSKIGMDMYNFEIECITPPEIGINPTLVANAREKLPVEELDLYRQKSKSKNQFKLALGYGRSSNTNEKFETFCVKKKISLTEFSIHSRSGVAKSHEETNPTGESDARPEYDKGNDETSRGVFIEPIEIGEEQFVRNLSALYKKPDSLIRPVLEEFLMMKYPHPHQELMKLLQHIPTQVKFYDDFQAHLKYIENQFYFFKQSLDHAQTMDAFIEELSILFKADKALIAEVLNAYQNHHVLTFEEMQKSLHWDSEKFQMYMEIKNSILKAHEKSLNNATVSSLGLFGQSASTGALQSTHLASPDSPPKRARRN